MINAINAMDRDGTLTVESGLVILSNDCAEIPQLHRIHFSPKEKVVCISVADTGQGIAEADLDKVFDPFYTTRRASGGMGLGLSVSRNIIDIHEGSISISNNRGSGACAKLHFKVNGG
jgi:signal transduction histidine kinase